jgi:hypothetical protein
VTGYVKPSIGLEVVTNSVREEVDHLAKDDVVVVCGGANNIGKN